MKNVSDIYPLTPTQELMLLRALRDPSDRALVNQFVYAVEGDFDADLLHSAWQTVVGRHDALRTAFAWEDLPHPVQAVRTKAEVVFRTIDVEASSEQEFQARLQPELDQDRAAGFNLKQPPLMRVLLVRAPAGVRLVWTCHHLVLDRGCFGLVFDDLLAAYDALARSETPVLDPAPQFGGHVRLLAKRDAEAARSFWRRHLADLAAPTLVARRLGVASTERSRLEVILDGDEFAHLREACRSRGLTVAALVQGALGLVLAGRAGGQDAVFGLSLSGRPADLPDAESIVGCFTHNLPVRLQIPESQTVAQWLRDVQITQARRSRAEHLSLTEISEAAGPSDGGALFDLLLLFVHGEKTLFRGAEFTLRAVSGSLDSPYAALLAVEESDLALRVEAVCDTAALPAPDAQDLLDQVRAAILAVAGGMDQPVRSLPRPEPVASPEEVRRAPPVGIAVLKPRNELEWRLATARADTLGVRTWNVHADFFDLGGDSLAAVRFVAAVERATGRKLPLTAVLEHRTIDSLARYMGKNGSPADSSLIVSFAEGGEDRAPVFVYEADAGLFFAKALERPRPVYGMIARHVAPEPLAGASLEEIAARYVREIQHVRPDGPLVLAGYCYAGVTALEIARQLAVAGRQPDLVVVVESAFPMRTLPYVLYLLRRRLPAWIGLMLRERGAVALALRTLRRESQLRLARWTPGRSAPVARSDVSEENEASQREDDMSAAVARYQPQPYAGPVLAIFGTETPVDQNHPRIDSWRGVAVGGFKAVNVPAENAEIVSRERMRLVVEALEAEEAERRSG